MIAGNIGPFVPSRVYTDSPHQFQINRPSRPMSWKRILGISAIPILIAAVIAPGVYVLMHRDDQKMVYDLDLTSGAAAPPRNAKFVNVTGVIAKPYVMSLKSVSDTAVVHWRYAPITEAGWTPRDPIRYVVAIAAGETSDYQVAWPVALQKSGVTRFSGSLGSSLSTIVESGFRSKGLKLADSYSVLSMRDLEDTSTFGWEDVLVLISLGAMLSLIAFAVLVKVRFANSRQSA